MHLGKRIARSRNTPSAQHFTSVSFLLLDFFFINSALYNILTISRENRMKKNAVLFKFIMFLILEEREKMLFKFPTHPLVVFDFFCLWVRLLHCFTSGSLENIKFFIPLFKALMTFTMMGFYYIFICSGCCETSQDSQPFQVVSGQKVKWLLNNCDIYYKYS